MRDYMVLLKDKVLNQIEDSWETKEVIKDLDEKMIVKVVNQLKGEMYYAFNETKNEHSRVRFLESDKFPDFFILSINPDGKIHWHICELKRTPAKHLEQLTGQLFSGYMHAKLLLSALHIDTRPVTYHYHVFLVREKNNENDYNRRPNQPKKLIPGNKIEDMEKYEQWLQNYLDFTDGDLCHRMPITKHRYDSLKDKVYYYGFSPGSG